MCATTTITVRGARFHQAGQLLRKGSLSAGTEVRLEHQPDNPHDRNAVAILVKSTGAMLGYVSKELAPKYSALANAGKIIEATVTKVANDGTKIDVRVVFEQSDDHLDERNSTRLWQSISTLPTASGVYSIRNIDSGRQYVGSSKNLKERIQSHFRDLSLRRHDNHALQSDFSRFGPNHFEARALASGVSPSQLAQVEADHISSLLNSGTALYNLTVTGQGTGHNPYGRNESEPISDRLVKQRADERKRRVDAEYAERKKQVRDTFDPQLSALLPQTNFLDYFIATFVSVLIVLSIFVPSGITLILSIVIALVVASTIAEHYREKARQSSQYQVLIGQRDKQLAALGDEHERKRDL